VHLSETIEAAKAAGQRHGKLILFEMDARRMYEDGIRFYRSTSGVWLTDAVPVSYLREINICT
jgi:putative RNA 2'-phosphotransferase